MSNDINPYAITQVDITQWEIVGYMYIGISEEMAADYGFDHRDLAMAIQARGLEETDVIYHDNGGCAACGTHFAHGAVVANVTTSELIAIGGICAGTWGYAEQVGVRKARAQRAQTLANDRQKNADLAADYLIENADIAEIFATIEHHIIEDIALKLPRYGSLTRGQEDLVRKIAAEEPARLERKDAAIAREEALAAAPELAEGRYTIEGLVISTKWKEGYGYGEMTLKMLVELDDLNRVWGTVPRSIFDEVEAADFRTIRVQFDAAVEKSQDDIHFGFYKRPTKATVSENARSNA